MRLKPHEILQLLGFNVGEDGVVINPDDAYLMRSVLELAGSTIDVERVPNAKLHELHHGLAEVTASWANMPKAKLDESTADRLRTTVALCLKNTFKHSP